MVAPFYAKIKAQLKADGHPIPENDIWIAACAMAYNLTVVTADKHFYFIKDIAIVNRQLYTKYVFKRGRNRIHRKDD